MQRPSRLALRTTAARRRPALPDLHQQAAGRDGQRPPYEPLQLGAIDGIGKVKLQN